MRKIVQDGDPVLRGIAAAVPEDMFGSKELDGIIDDMAKALDVETDGVAIAAPQVGVPLRLFLVRYDRLLPAAAGTMPEPELGVYINPEFTRSSRRREEMDEGCLSVRGRYGKTYRHERATIRARAADGSTFERGGGGILAQVFQHEVDHLNGILFIDHAIDIFEARKEDAPAHATSHASE